jgi:4-hydroxybenzoate polyprenyltransferase
VALAGGENTGTLMLVMLLGSAITRAAGCIINDLTDRKLDAQVERTRTRPLASGAITTLGAIAVLLALGLAALALALSLTRAVVALALLAAPMIAAYPWMKRLTWWPQLFLGLTFNLGVLMGWLATGSALTAPTFTLYTASILWTLGYDTIYAMQDMDDDARAGIRSSARALGTTRIRRFVALCYGLMLALLALTGALAQEGWGYYTGLAAVAAQLLWQIRALPCPPDKAGALFRSNQWVGLLLLMGLLWQRML